MNYRQALCRTAFSELENVIGNLSIAGNSWPKLLYVNLNLTVICAPMVLFEHPHEYCQLAY